MSPRGTGKGPYGRKQRALAWLVLGVMLYAGGLGHLLHPWLHGHPPRHARPAGGISLVAPVKAHVHGPCALCAFLAHFPAGADTPLARVESGLACSGQAPLLSDGPLPAAACPPRAPLPMRRASESL